MGIVVKEKIRNINQDMVMSKVKIKRDLSAEMIKLR